MRTPSALHARPGFGAAVAPIGVLTARYRLVATRRPNGFLPLSVYVLAGR